MLNNTNLIGSLQYDLIRFLIFW